MSVKCFFDLSSVGPTRLRIEEKKYLIINRIRIGHTKLTRGHFMAAEEQPRCTTSGTELTIKHILTERLQNIDELKNLNIPDTLDAALGPD